MILKKHTVDLQFRSALVIIFFVTTSSFHEAHTHTYTHTTYTHTHTPQPPQKQALYTAITSTTVTQARSSCYAHLIISKHFPSVVHTPQRHNNKLLEERTK